MSPTFTLPLFFRKKVNFEFMLPGSVTHRHGRHMGSRCKGHGHDLHLALPT